MVPISGLRYVIPNAVTALSLLSGFAAILHASAGHFERAAWFIIWCVLFDAVDGHIARSLNAQSHFGAEFDSLADLAAFCAAPAALAYFILTLDPLYASHFEAPLASAELHITVAAYLLSGALRLASYNTLANELRSHQFQGMPTTTAGGIVASFVLCVLVRDLPASWGVLLPILMMICAMLMILNLPLLRPMAALGVLRPLLVGLRAPSRCITEPDRLK